MNSEEGCFWFLPDILCRREKEGIKVRHHISAGSKGFLRATAGANQGNCESGMDNFIFQVFHCLSVLFSCYCFLYHNNKRHGGQLKL